SDHIYFNAGVLLINLKKWQEINVFNQAILILKEKKDLLRFQDQDLLNIIFKDSLYVINPRFNFMFALFKRLKQLNAKEIDALNTHEEVKNPIVIYHYCGKRKPWNIEVGKKDLYEIKASLYQRYAEKIGMLKFCNNTRTSILKKIKIWMKSIKIYFLLGIR
ncbi:glycosyltransferase family 8 protein, partial [Basilea psittacipulmonis]